MATQKPISTISYNSEAFLREKLDDWVKAHIIQAYQYIAHKGEDGDKDHIHVRIEPNKKLDPMDLTEQLKEYVSSHPKPLGCRPWRSSKEEDWYLYAVHDSEYLKLKYNGGEKGEKIPYKWSDIKASDDYDVETGFIRAKASLKHSTSGLASRLRSGEDPAKLVMSGESPFTVGAILKVLSDNDYLEAIKERNEAQARYTALVEAIISLGYDVSVKADGSVELIDIRNNNNGRD